MYYISYDLLAFHSSHSGREKAGRTLTSDPPLPLLVTQSLDEGLYSHPGTRHTETLEQHPEVVAARSRPITATLPTVAFPSPGNELDESFAVELPPASQLDVSVLDALPAALKDKILKSYGDSRGSKDEPRNSQPEAHSSPAQQPRGEPPVVPRPAATDQCPGEPMYPTPPSHNSPCTVEDESDFLSAFRAYLKDWVDHFANAPRDDDVEKVTDFLLDLSRSNLTVLLSVLRYFRRLLARPEHAKWFPAFNFLLSILQGDVMQRCRGSLPVLPL